MKNSSDWDCDYEIYLGITPKIKTPNAGDKSSGTAEERWMILLLNPETEKCTWYYSLPKHISTSTSTSHPDSTPILEFDPDLEDGDSATDSDNESESDDVENHLFSKSPSLPFTLNPFTSRIRIGTLHPQNLALFESTFYETRATNSQEFAGWFVLNLAELGLLEVGVAWDVVLGYYCPGYEAQHLDLDIGGEWGQDGDGDDGAHEWDREEKRVWMERLEEGLMLNESDSESDEEDVESPQDLTSALCDFLYVWGPLL